MWYTNKSVNRTYAHVVTKYAYASIDSVPGNFWKRLSPTSTDGVTNTLSVLSEAKARNRRVDVFISGGQIQRAILR